MEFSERTGSKPPLSATALTMAGKSLSKACVKALIQSGEVSQAEVDRRKKSGR
jgi:hypothetical protein